MISRVRYHYPKELYYVLGALLGDGCAYRWKNEIGARLILAGDEQFCTKYAAAFSICKRKIVKAYPNRTRGHWFVSARNDEIFSLFEEMRNHTGRIVRFLDQGDFEENARQFVEGFFDAEGCVKLVKEKIRKVPKVCLDITNTDFELLEVVRYLLLQFGIIAKYSSQKGSVGNDGYRRKRIYHLRIYNKKGVKKFFSLVSTTKLTEKKKPFVDQWLSVDNCNTRYSGNSLSLVPN